MIFYPVSPANFVKHIHKNARTVKNPTVREKSFSCYFSRTTPEKSYRLCHGKEKKLIEINFNELDVVAGAGFEPYDLRVMSPTSYRAAPPRDIYLIGIPDCSFIIPQHSVTVKRFL